MHLKTVHKVNDNILLLNRSVSGGIEKKFDRVRSVSFDCKVYIIKESTEKTIKQYFDELNRIEYCHGVHLVDEKTSHYEFRNIHLDHYEKEDIHFFHLLDKAEFEIPKPKDIENFRIGFGSEAGGDL